MFVAIAVGAVVALTWLGRSLRWEVVDDDRLDYEGPRRRGAPGGLRTWLRRHAWPSPRQRLLTYRRDRLGRFRRYRH
jgi:hypothetical protein